MNGLLHHDARHGTVDMVDASDEDGSSLSFNSGGAVASSQRPPSSCRPPLGLVMISPGCPPPRVSLVVDLFFLDDSENGGLPLRLGFHELNTEERAAQTDAKPGWAGPNGPTGLGLFWAGSGPFFSLNDRCGYESSL
jgi:hypothetical protein